MAGDNKQLDLRPADPLTRIDSKLNQVVPWSLHTFPQISCKSVQPFSRNVADKERNNERNKERNRAKTKPRPPTGGGVIIIIITRSIWRVKTSAEMSVLFCWHQSAATWRIIVKYCYSTLTWAVNPPIVCYRLQSRLPLIIGAARCDNATVALMFCCC